MREFRTAIALNPGKCEARTSTWEWLLGPRYQLDEAVAHLRRAVEINPRHADGYHNLSVADGLQGRIGEGITAAQAALRLKPDSPAAQQQLQRLLAETVRATAQTGPQNCVKLPSL